jgi:hypothetical protein
MGNEEISSEETRVASHELLHDCLERITAGDPAGFHNLAFFWMGHVTDRDPVIELGLAEGLMRQAAAMGNAEAENFLRDAWPDTRVVLAKSLSRKK